MATRNIVPRANNEGGIGTTSKKWANVWATLVNALTMTAQAVGFTISGGTTSKTLTVDEDVTMSAKANLASPTFTGTVDVSGATLTLANDQISGDKINGGTISAFASTGIVDTATSTAITIDSNEKVGIGTSSPGAKCHINVITGQSASLTYTSSASNEGFLVNAYYNSSDSYRRYVDLVALGDQNGAVGGSAIRFLTNPVNSYDAIERVRVDRDGNVGIGTASPGSKLDVVGEIRSSGSGSRISLWNSDGSDKWEILNGYSSDSDGLLTFYDRTNTTARMAISNSSGNVGIGTTSPSVTLDVQGSGYTGIQLKRRTDVATVSGVLYFDTSTSGCVSMRGDTGSLVFLYGTVVGSTSGTVCGSIGASGAWTVTNLAGSGNRAVYSDGNGTLTNSSSDQSLKTNIINIPYGLNQVLALKPIKFNWLQPAIKGDQSEIGFIAQEVKAIIPEVVGMNYDGMLSLDYPKLTAVLCKAIQELDQKLEDHLNA